MSQHTHDQGGGDASPAPPSSRPDEDATAEDQLRYAIGRMQADLGFVLDEFAAIRKALDEGQAAKAVQMIHDLHGVISDDLGAPLPDRIEHMKHMAAAFAWDSPAFRCCRVGIDEENVRLAEIASAKRRAAVAS